MYSFSIWDGKYPQTNITKYCCCKCRCYQTTKLPENINPSSLVFASPVGDCLFSANTSDRIQGNGWDHLPLTAEQLKNSSPPSRLFCWPFHSQRKKCKVTLEVLNPCLLNVPKRVINLKLAIKMEPTLLQTTALGAWRFSEKGISLPRQGTLRFQQHPGKATWLQWNKIEVSKCFS